MSAVAEQRDPYEARIAAGASGLLREFNRAGVLSVADVHVARRLGKLGSETDDTVLLAVALAVRAPRLGHVHVDLDTIRDTAAVESEDPIDLATLPWPEIEHVDRRGRREPADRQRGIGGADAAAASRTVVAVPRPLLGRGGRRRRPASRDAVGAALGDRRRSRCATASLACSGQKRTATRRRAAAEAVRRQFAVVAGGPGTGKTTTVAQDRRAALRADAGADRR